MRRQAIGWAVGFGLVLGLSARSGAQVVPPAGGAGAASTAGVNSPYAGSTGFNTNPYLSPYANPYMNPFVNPYMMNGPNTSGSTAMGLYMMNAQRYGNGIGSGKLGGPNATIPGRKAKAKPGKDESPVANAANTPGGSAARYFSRTNPTNTGAVRFFNRPPSR